MARKSIAILVAVSVFLAGCNAQPTQPEPYEEPECVETEQLAAFQKKSGKKNKDTKKKKKKKDDDDCD